MSTKLPSANIAELAAIALDFLQSSESGDSRALSELTPDAAWRGSIERLAAWSKDPHQLFEADLEAPATEVIQWTYELAQAIRDLGASPPLRVVPTGDGGIVLEFQRGTDFDTLEITPAGAIEIVRFNGNRVVRREQLFVARH
jgi:hypothetical protein